MSYDPSPEEKQKGQGILTKLKLIPDVVNPTLTGLKRLEKEAVGMRGVIIGEEGLYGERSWPVIAPLLAKAFKIKLEVEPIEDTYVPTCKVCKCTETKPCLGDDGPCSWTDPSKTLCTLCVAKAKCPGCQSKAKPKAAGKTKKVSRKTALKTGAKKKTTKKKGASKT